MITAVAETFNFGAGLLAPFALLFVVVSFATSPFIVAWWIADALRGRINVMLADPSEQARFVVAFHAVTTILVIILVVWRIRS